MEIQQLSLASGRKIIKSYADGLSHSSGVYMMIDTENKTLYVGKAKSLKNRVLNYVNSSALNTRLQRMISLTAKMEIISTRSEAEALLLEANLIKKYSPRYNILLKDDKSFPYIYFSADHDFPRISKHRGAKIGKGKYFGPFVSAGAVDETITILQKAFLLRNCSDNIFKNRTRPCLQYQIKRCSAPCVDYISKEDYAELNRQAYDFLAGKSRQIQEELLQEMQEASTEQDYEKASIIRDRIRCLTQVQQQSKLSSGAVEDADLIALAKDGDDCSIQIFSFRGGRNYGSKNYFPSNTKEHTGGEIIASFIAQFYQAQPVPKLILTSEQVEDAQLLEEALRLNTDYAVTISCPQRGEKRELMEQALRNAREALSRHLSTNISQKAALQGVQELFGLDEIPKRIEVYDNSHISGTNQVGAMIVAGADGFIKNQYRKFDIKGYNLSSPPPSGDLEQNSELPACRPRPPIKSGVTVEGKCSGIIKAGGDDYAMLREVLTRRFKRLQDEQQNKPDLVLIDGGAGQLSVATQVFDELGIDDIVYVGIAKGEDRNAGREHFFMRGRAPFQLPENDATLHYLQRLRDEAHRFAIGAHRNKRSKSMQVSELDAIAGIGAARKKALLHHFGSARAVAAASIEEIGLVEGISKEKAKIIYNHFHGNVEI
jgi:excinuclease ABC subunit C